MFSNVNFVQTLGALLTELREYPESIHCSWSSGIPKSLPMALRPIAVEAIVMAYIDALGRPMNVEGFATHDEHHG